MPNKLIWILLGDKLGDNAQVISLGELLKENLSCTVESKQITYKKKYKGSNLKLQATLDSIIKNQSDSLNYDSPPDLIIFTGRRAVPVARWLQKKSLDEYGVRTKLVSIGKPRAPFFWFDLIISTRQYLLPRWLPNLILNNFTLNRPDSCFDSRPKDEQRLNPQSKLAIVLLGGERSGFKISPSVIEHIIQTLKQYQIDQPNHQLTMVASKSTPEKVLVDIAKNINRNINIFDWHSSDKPSYQSLLKNGDVFFVSEDSASMVTEAIATGKQVYLIKLHQKNKIRYYSLFHWLKQLAILTVYPFGLYDPDRFLRKFTQNLEEKNFISSYSERNKKISNINIIGTLDNEFKNTINKINGLL